MSQYQWTYPKGGLRSTAGEDNREDKVNGGEPEEMWPKQKPHHLESKDHASNAEGRDTSLGSVVHGLR